MKWIVQAVEPTRDYKLILTYKSGKRIFDFTPFLQDPINTPLRDIDFFMKAYVHHHTVAWNEDIDFCPEYLYENSKVYK